MNTTLWVSACRFDEVKLRIASTSEGVCRIGFLESDSDSFARWVRRYFPGAEEVEDPGNHKETIEELEAYFAGELRAFRARVDLRGTEFQKRVWNFVREIPYGETRSYADISRTLGSPGIVRAIGAANGANPVPIIVPCHRVIGSDGSLTGYGGGLSLKRRLLELEGVEVSAEQCRFEFGNGLKEGSTPDR